MIEVDVVIPVRDVDRYLAEAVDSVLDQVGARARVTVVDAGSATPVALDPRHAANTAVRLLRHEEPLLAGAARNLGAAAGSLPWLLFLDGDDVAVGESLARLAAAAATSPSGVAVGHLTAFHADASATVLGLPAGEPVAYAPGGVLVARSTWDAVGPFDPDLRAGEFVDWLGRLRGAGFPAVEIPDVVVRRRIHLSSTTARQLREGARDDYLKVVRRWMRQTGS